MFWRRGSVPSRLFYRDCDLAGHYRRFMRDMAAVAENQLQGMRTGRQLNGCFCLTFAEMQVLLITGDGPGFIGQIRIDQKVVMA